jgi:excisionase family DNA binding protein
MHSSTVPFSAPTKPPAPIVEPVKTLTEVAELLQVSRRTIERLVASGKLRSVRIGANIRVEPLAIRDYLDRGQ